MCSSTRVDPDNAALAIRATLAAKMEAQTRCAKECGLKINVFNAFLRRRLNLLDSDIERVLGHLGIDLERIGSKKKDVPNE